VAAGDGKKGLELFYQDKPALVLLDLMMPEMDGFEVLENIRKTDGPDGHTPVIVLSNLWSNKDILRVQTLHADAYMVKAYYTTEEILKKINEILNK
jgi:DNA-binding response OmpR family regulator